MSLFAFWGRAVFPQLPERTLHWPLLALEGSVERSCLSASQERKHLVCSLRHTVLLQPFKKRIKSVRNSTVLEGEMCSLLKWKFGLGDPCCCERRDLVAVDYSNGRCLLTWRD